ncbi:hypothetical protein QBC45DRAFT_406312 [Copromyces sp. CBS 386.78]|nr:hypothetical protein QBC45DRAFT_406312 [Copromyces sp. CBS 386.78]
MAPSLARPSLNGVQSILSSSTTTCAAATSVVTRAVATRSFSTTRPARDSAPPPPDSPNYIKVPEPPQSSEVRHPFVKGHLPVPRSIFPKKGVPEKVQPGYVDRIMPKPAAVLAGKSPVSEKDSLRRTMAEARRKSLAEGLKGLWQRKVKRDKKQAKESKARYLANKQAAQAPERLDEVFTRATIRESTAKNTFVPVDPEAFEKAEVARIKHAEREAMKSEARRDALIQLYVASKNFIVDEKELEEHVNKHFTEKIHNAGLWESGRSIWDSQKNPISMRELRNEFTGFNDRVTATTSAAVKTTVRQKNVAEELTGGKL